MFNLTNKVKKAFTLAEVLITIGIIGVVASMTIPTLMKDIEKKDLVTANKKARAVLLAGLKKAAYDNGGTLNGYNLGANLGEYFRLAKNCNTATTDRYSCWHATGVAKMPQRDGTYVDWAGATTGSAVTMDGMFLRISSGVLNCGREDGTVNRDAQNTGSQTACYTVNYGDYCTTIYADLNGSRKPNVFGQDIREIQVYSDGYVKFPGDSSGSHGVQYTQLQDSSSYTSTGDCYDPNSYSVDKLSD